MVTGLSLQIFSRARKGSLNSKHAALRHSHNFHSFLYGEWSLYCDFNFIGLSVVTLCILTRSCFRVAELRHGFGSKLANQQVTFMVLEGAMIVIASVTLTALHPGVAF